MLEFKYRPIKYNSSSRYGNTVKWIVVHDTANYGVGANAMAHQRYFGGGNRNSSAHYFVDDKEIVQIIGDSLASWHCGDNQGKGRALNGCTNLNSIGVELCVNKDGDYNKAWLNLVELIKNLMIKFNTPVNHVCRHYDVSRKRCPSSMYANDWAKWKEFVKAIQEPLRLKIDLSKDSVAEVVGIPNSCPIPTPQSDKYCKLDKAGKVVDIVEYKEQNGLQMLITDRKNIYQQFIGGKTVRQTGAYGINGTFFDMGNRTSPDGCCYIAVNKGKAISDNARYNCKYGSKRGTFIIDDKGNMYIERLSKIDDFTKAKVHFAVGGVELIPNYSPESENTAPDILRYAYHTAIGFKGKKVYLIVTSVACTMAVFRQKISLLGLSGAIALDGGGSSQLFWKDNKGLKQKIERGLCTMIGVERS